MLMICGEVQDKGRSFWHFEESVQEMSTIQAQDESSQMCIWSFSRQVSGFFSALAWYRR
jgi:hypothetical protein